MTNTLHRQGSIESLRGDFVIFAHAASGYNKEGCAPKLKEFLLICLKYDPVNMGTGEFYPQKASFIKELLKKRRTEGMTPEEREEALKRRWAEMIGRIDDDSGAYAVFDDSEKLSRTVSDIKRANLGISICVSGLHDLVDEILRQNGIIRHSIEHSLGIHGNVGRLPPRHILEISSMCGHGLVSFSLVRKVMEEVKLGRITPQRGAEYLAKPCLCGVFNRARAAILLHQYRDRV